MRRQQHFKSAIARYCTRETFLFNFAEIKPVHYTMKPEGFIDLYNSARVIRREVKESYFNNEKTTAFQICYCEILHERDVSV